MSKNDQYGLTPPEERWEPAWREETGESTTAPDATTDAMNNAEHDVIVEHDEQEAPDRSTDPRYIRVETPEYEAGRDQATKGFNISTGRTLITYRLRKPEEKGLDHVVGEPHYPVPMLTAKPRPPREPGDEWLPGVPEKLLRDYLVGPDKPVDEGGAGSFHRWMRGGFGR